MPKNVKPLSNADVESLAHRAEELTQALHEVNKTLNQSFPGRIGSTTDARLALICLVEAAAETARRLTIIQGLDEQKAKIEANIEAQIMAKHAQSKSR